MDHWLPMRTPIFFLAALLALPFVELALLLKLGAMTEWWVPLLAVIVMAGVGTALIRSMGWLTVRQFREELEQRPVPGNAILDALCLFFAGLLFLFPGILTDLLGVLLLLPPTRFLFKRAIIGWIRSGVRDAHVTVRVTVDGRPFTVVDGDEAAVKALGRTLPSDLPRLPAVVEAPPPPETR
jgi:UPF0716 protein FxsA